MNKAGLRPRGAMLRALALALVVAPRVVGSASRLRFEASNDYTTRIGHPIAGQLPWVDATHVVVDVARPFTLRAKGARSACEATTWTLTDAGGRAVRLDGAKPEPVTLDAAGAYALVLEEAACAGGEARRVDGELFALHVRRELRELSRDDLDATLDAMEVLWRVDGPAGRKKYGPNYTSVHELANIHLQNAGQRDADHFHEGFGFLSQHAKMSFVFEKGLQAVDKALTLPYWDQTIENAQLWRGELDDEYHTDIFSPRMFGTINHSWVDLDASDWREPMYAKFAIQDGRWAFERVGTVADAPPGSPANAYGLLRTPWNQNPSPYVTRFATNRRFPNCMMVFAVVKPPPQQAPALRTAAWWIRNVEFLPHGPAHAGIGGGMKWNTQATETALRRSGLAKRVGELAAQPSVARTFAQIQPFASHRALWRHHFIDFPDACAGPATSCVASVAPGVTDEALGREIVRAQLSADMKNAVASRVDELATPRGFGKVGRAFRDHMVGFLSGDHASLALDPSFWPIHPAVERVYMFRLLHGGFSNESWTATDDAPCSKGGPMRAHPGDAADACYRPDRKNASAPPDEWVGDGCCYGHRERDGWYEAFPHKTGGIENQEMLGLLDVRTRGPFVDRGAPVYHHLRWDHCEWFRRWKN
mmetsp:Transcript_16903/g.58236  ORF Transcript_16903/g.58236 Transcript_16903/m.58236 type:complete len:648 (-) Transcript_16903:69-2012(-)